MQQTPKGIVLLRELLKPENRAKLMSWDENRIKNELEKCCNNTPLVSCEEECKNLHSKVCDFIPCRKERIETAPKFTTIAQRYAGTLPVLSRSSLKYAYHQKQNSYLC